MVFPVANWNEIMLSGGPIAASNRAENALNDARMATKLKELEAKYYDAKAQSDINSKNSSTREQDITNTYLPEKLRLGNQNQANINQAYLPNIQSEMAARNALTNKTNTMTPLEAQKMKTENQFAPQLTQSQINSNNAMANLRNMGGSGMGVGGQEMMRLQNQLKIDHPDWDPLTANQAASAYITGENTLPDGTALPPLSGLAESGLAQIGKRNSNSALQNQAANMDILANDINAIDIGPPTKFTGIGGAFKYAKYTANMALGLPVPQEFRDYVAFKDVTANFSMDALRKGFGTSVVPDYVYATLRKAAQPNSTWWFDPQQVITEWNATKNWINKNAKSYTKKSTRGIGVNVDDESKSNASTSDAKNVTKWRLNPATGTLDKL